MVVMKDEKGREGNDHDYYYPFPISIFYIFF